MAAQSDPYNCSSHGGSRVQRRRSPCRLVWARLARRRRPNCVAFLRLFTPKLRKKIIELRAQLTPKYPDRNHEVAANRNFLAHCGPSSLMPVEEDENLQREGQGQETVKGISASSHVPGRERE